MVYGELKKLTNKNHASAQSNITMACVSECVFCVNSGHRILITRSDATTFLLREETKHTHREREMEGEREGGGREGESEQKKTKKGM